MMQVSRAETLPEVKDAGWCGTRWGTPFPLVFLNGLFMTEGDDYIMDEDHFVFNENHELSRGDKISIVTATARHTFLVTERSQGK